MPNLIFGLKPFHLAGRLITSTPGRFVVERLLRSLVIIVMGFVLAGQTSATAPDETSAVEIDAAKAQESWLAAGATGLLAPEPLKGLAEIAPGNIGWFDYDFNIDRQGWYRLLVAASPHIARTEFLFDPTNPAGGMRLVGNTPLGNGRFYVGWVWLTQGAHRLRVQHLFWTGLPRITRLRLEAPPSAQSFAFRVVPPEKTAFVIGACDPLAIETGGNSESFVVDVTFSLKGRFHEKRQIAIPPSQTLTRHSLDLPCDTAGDIAAELRASGARADLNARARVDYAVFDTSPIEPTFRRGRLAVEIDAATREPDFRSGETSVSTGPAGVYRVSGDLGSTPFARRGGTPPHPNWFAYRVSGLLPDRPYILEVEYPDDEPRVFVAALRDSRTKGYPTSIGAETGVIWPLSGQMAKMSAIFWPSSSDARVILVNIHDGMRAAVGRIRIYEAISEEAPRASTRDRGRDMVFWYEEGDNFRDVVGGGHEAETSHAPVDRYLKLARYSGATIASPTVVVYGFAMYPSQFHLAFRDDDRDMTAAFMLGAERYGLKIVPQLHPRADELLWPPRDKISIERRLLLSADGQSHLVRPDGDMFRPPFYNPLDADVRSWYVDMIGELANRYKDYPAFAGVDLRVSDWQNPALNNLVSLDWGYSAETVARFFRETGRVPRAGLDVTTDTPEAARRRHDELVGRHRAAWIAWRCEKMRDLYRDIARVVRSARPDLRLYVSVFVDRQPSSEKLRETGIDLDLLGAIDGLTIIDLRFGYGAREASPAWRRVNRDALGQAAFLKPSHASEGRPHIIVPMEYIEIIDKVAPAKAVGLPAPRREPWISSASEPPGRLALGRFATIVGLADAFMLGDGGNGYVFAGDILREFMAEFRSLPRLPFERIAGLPDAVVVRQRPGMFYVVNMLNMPVSARLRLNAPGSVTRATSGQIATVSDGILSLDLLPYQMAAFDTETGRRVIGAEVGLGREAELGFTARATATRQSADALCGRSRMTDKRCTEARTRSRKIEAAIARGDYWTAERLLQAE